MSSFWSSEDSIPISQTKVSVPDQQGGAYTAGQKIDFYIPPTSKFIQPKECALSMDVKLNLPAGLTDTNGRMRVQLDADLGAQVLIRDITISTGGAGNEILEQIQGYNTLCSVRYDYETNESMKNKRQLTEGATGWTPDCRGTCGTTRSDGANCRTSPWFKPHQGIVADTVHASSDYYTAKVLLPINTGLFQSDRVLPVMLTEGLRISIILEDSVKCFRMLDSVNPGRHLSLHPAFVSTDGSDQVPQAEGASIASGDDLDKIYIQRTNQQTSVSNCGLVVGQVIKFVNSIGTSDGVDGFTYDEVTATSSSITAIDFIAASGTNGLVRLTMSGGVTAGGAVTRDFVIADGSLETATSYRCTYEVSDCEMIIQQVDMPDGYERSLMNKMSAGGQVIYDYMTYTNYKFSQQSSDRVMNMRLPLSESRAKAILCVPTDAQVYSPIEALNCRTSGDPADSTSTYVEVNATGPNEPDGTMNSNRSGIVGVWDNLTDYQFFYDGKLNPNREVNCSRISANSVDQQPLIELEKALVMSGIKPLSFLKFKNNAVIGRALSLDRGVYDCRGRDFSLQANYQGSANNGRGTDGPSKPHLWNNYLAHLRRLSISGSSLTVTR